jgi:hypothetical protein
VLRLEQPVEVIEVTAMACGSHGTKENEIWILLNV